MTRSPDEWRRLDQRVLWHPFTQMRDWQRQHPLIIERAEGFHLIDVDGRRYIDGHSSLWLNLHGHAHPRIIAAIADQAARLDHSTLLGLGNTPAIALAERLISLAPAGLSRVFYSDSGSTAVEIAVKMAFQFWRLRDEPRRQRFVTFRGAYHGDTIGSVSVGAIDLFHGVFRELLFPALACPWPRPYRDPDGADPARVRDRCLASLAETLSRHRGEIAAIVCEAGIQAADGMYPAPPGWMAGVARLAREHQALLIVDEVATGFCRTGTMFACEHEGIRPDLMAVAKGLSGGVLPLAATLTTEAIYDAFLGDFADMRHFFHGHSYTGNPIACAAALASLDLIHETGLLGDLPRKTALLAQALAPLRDHPHVGDVRQLGLMAGIELVADRTSGASFPTEWQVPQRVVLAARERGAVIRPLGPVMVLVPPPAMPDALLVELVRITRDAIDAVVAAPAPP